MFNQYYFVISALPELKFGVKPDLSFKEVKEMLHMNLSRSDLEKVKQLLRPIDLYNIRAFWLGLPLNDDGNFASKDLEEALLVRDMLPEYLIDFLERYDSTQDRLRYFSSLYVSLFRDEQLHLTGFLLKYYQMQREMRLVLTALRAKRFGRDLVRELQFEDPYDPFVAEILAQKDALEYIPPAEYEELKTLFVENSPFPRKLDRALLLWQFEKLEEWEENHDFSIERVLNYVARYLLVASWDVIDKQQGMQALEELSQYG